MVIEQCKECNGAVKGIQNGLCFTCAQKLGVFSGGSDWISRSSPTFQKYIPLASISVIGLTVLAAIVSIGYIVISGLIDAGSEISDLTTEGNTCESLTSWYESAPGDSNLTIARDYYRLCGELPPPVWSGELLFQNGQITTR
ncbi:hypothetical protein SAMN02799641_05882 [Rhodococcus erythropolis]|uniref:hypothetical protein n=1 Tax=Rhodococcus erythropolis TaxID=1833 RepID=UPI0008773B53|nr:hypothetical protein [Rhodococcus erythropolis]MCS4258001.1 hypothetical protein [Rhodococcus erythropolis]MCW2430104.1 hypothetical protein [Rhodococcus erythropolis]SCZ14940.1 hypothetical protein SAMN02799641_05882 [Rhodococcus erythropolis]